MSIAIAKVAAATVQRMEKGLIEWRKERLQALADAVGGKAELGRLLKHKSGAFVGQMLSGHRPISEKTVRAIEALPGRKGWFARGGPQPNIFEALTPEEQAFLDDFRTVTDADRKRYAGEIAARAEEMREYLAKHMDKAGLPVPKSAAERSRRKAEAAVETAQKHLFKEEK